MNQNDPNLPNNFHPDDGSEQDAEQAAPPRRRRPRGELFKEPAAAVVWAGIQGLDRGLQHAVYDRLGELLVTSETSADKFSVHERRVARAIDALREAADLLEAEGRARKVGIEAYRRLRKENPRLGLPADGSIRRWCGGSWNDALRRAQLETVPDGDALVREIGPAFTKREILDALVEYHELGKEPIPSIGGYLGWAKSPEVRSLPGRRPQSLTPFTRLFGGFVPALIAAGLVRGDAKTGIATAGHLKNEGGRRVFYRSAAGYSSEQIRVCLREIGARIGGQITVEAYKHERELIFAEEQAAGAPPRPICSAGMIQQRYRSWDDALRDAGLPPSNGRHVKTYRRPIPHSKRITDEEILAALRRGYDEAAVDGRLTSVAYRAWRKRVLAAAAKQGRLEVIPETSCIWERFGGFVAALRKALKARCAGPGGAAPKGGAASLDTERRPGERTSETDDA